MTLQGNSVSRSRVRCATSFLLSTVLKSSMTESMPTFFTTPLTTMSWLIFTSVISPATLLRTWQRFLENSRLSSVLSAATSLPTAVEFASTAKRPCCLRHADVKLRDRLLHANDSVEASSLYESTTPLIERIPSVSAFTMPAAD